MPDPLKEAERNYKIWNESYFALKDELCSSIWGRWWFKRHNMGRKLIEIHDKHSRTFIDELASTCNYGAGK